MKAINITAYPNDISQIEAIKAVMKALKIDFEITNEDMYNPDFVTKIEKSRQDFKDGKGTVVTLEELNTLWR